MRLPVSALTALLLLPGCQTAPQGPPVQVRCPVPPPLARVPLGPSYTERMQQWLSGSLETPTSTGQLSKPATGGPTK